MRTVWNRWKYHLNALVLGAALVYAPGFVSGAHWADMGERVLEPKPIGPYAVILGEEVVAPPKRDAYGKLTKDYNIILSPDGAKAAKAAHLRVGEPGTPATDGVILNGNPYRLHAHVPFPETHGPDDELWLTVETWDGGVHQISWPLHAAMGTGTR